MMIWLAGILSQRPAVAPVAAAQGWGVSWGSSWGGTSLRGLGSITTITPWNEDATLQYNGGPVSVATASGDLVLVYGQSLDHAGTSAKLVSKRSTDGGDTWSSAVLVSDFASVDDRNHTVGISDTGVISVPYRLYNGSTTTGQKFVLSADGGLTWGTPADRPGNLSSGAVPYGTPVKTSLGYIWTIYSGGYAEIVKTTSAMNDWTSVGVAYTGYSGTNEPAMVALDDSRVVIGCRTLTNSSRDYRFFTSADGGATWTHRGLGTSLVSGGASFGAPLWFDRTSGGDIVCAFTMRGENKNYYCLMDPETFWANPAATFAAADKTVLSVMPNLGSDDDEGYVTTSRVADHIFASWYESDGGDDKCSIKSVKLGVY